MSPIEYPDLLEDDGGRGRRKGGGLVATLKSRSRSRSRARAERRSASCQPTERRRSKEDEKATEKKKRRSLSRPARPSNSSSPKIKFSKTVDVLEENNKAKKSRSRTMSPSKRRLTGEKTKEKQFSPDVINLVGREDEDEDKLLSEILSGKNPTITIKKKTSKPESKKDLKSRSSSKDRKALSKSDTSPSRKESTAPVSSESPKSVGRFPESKGYSDDELSDDDSEDEEEEETNSVATNELLDQVKSRMEQQRLMEEAKELRKTIEKKDAEIDQLTGQLRMAISTKCDLVIAHTELERLHEMDLKQRDQFAEYMKRSNLELVELRAEIEKEFMNELNDLSKQVQEAEERRVQDIQEKDETIRLLQDKIRRLEFAAMGGVSVRRDDDKVKYYKKKLGVIED